ncbi:MAG: hypothetical protein J3R72DRAFT_510001 [Linnemannia gamsii]|nr:MAG: hypothetical protein J3R72DRAFT_510001 [Linnemannia gamsii]
MGIVDLDCIAATPNSTALYGIGRGESSEGGVYTVLYYSNDNPANVTDITWKYKGTVPDHDHYKYSHFGNVDCAISSSGEFTAFFYNPVYSVTGSSKPVPMGIKVHLGYWSDGRGRDKLLLIWGNMMYGWTSEHFVHQSFYIDKDGIATVVHAVMDETASVVRFGLVDQETGYLQLAAVWKLVDGRFMVGELTDRIPKLPNPKATTYKHRSKYAINSDQRHMVYMNGTLYMYSDSTGLISSFPFPNVLVTPTQKDLHQASPIANDTRNMFFQGTRQNSSYLSYLTQPARDPTTETNITMQLTTIDLINSNPDNIVIINTTTTGIDSSSVYQDVAMFQAIGGYLPGQESFAVGLGVDGYYGMTLGGSSMGNGTSIIEGVKDVGYYKLRSRIRNYNNQVVPGYKIPTPIDQGIQIAHFIGVFVAVCALPKILKSINNWLTKIRLAEEKYDADRNSYELVARLQHAGVSSGDAGFGLDGTRFVFSPTAEALADRHASANTSAHTLFEGLGLTRHPRPTTVITIGDDDEPAPIPIDTHTQSSP